MPSKEQQIANLSKAQYGKAEVVHLMSNITHIEATDRKNPTQPIYLQKGDVFIQECGQKKRPVVIVKVLKDIVIGIPLSTTQDCLNLGVKSNSRFFGEGYFSNHFVSAPIDYAMRNFTGVYSNEKLLRKAQRVLKEFANQVL